ncbi:MAG: leucyl aminopeptidase [Betaproteobacteria bacterium]|nr:leucyl aminopeptidase [Betaproteobacteria bacterium]
MEFSTKNIAPGLAKTGCVIVGVFESRKLCASAAALDRTAKGFVSKAVASGDMDGRAGTTLLLRHVPNTACERVLLVGLGEEKSFNEKAYRKALAAAFGAVNATGAADAEMHLTSLAAGASTISWRVAQAAALAIESAYRFEHMKSKPDANARAIKRLTLAYARAGDRQGAERGLEHGLALGHGVSLAKDLGNLPGNVCTPGYLADQARELAKRYRSTGMKVKVLEREDMEKLGMRTLLSVAAGSAEPPKFIVLEYLNGPKKQKPVVLVGKGITFDTGGISLKPGGGMDEMKFDMSGAGSVLGTFKAVGEMRLPVNVVGLIAATENMPGGRATKPGDIIKSMSGQTVEILNTDAEGRLVLCDALTYAERYEPAAVIDIATLTGACVIALGHVVCGLFANDDKLAQEVLAAGETAHDRAWHMPLHDEYQDQLKSNFADFANIGGRPAGAVTAACYLSRFAKKFKWAHLDVAGTAWKSGREKGSTGRPVPLLTQFLISRADRS